MMDLQIGLFCLAFAIISSIVIYLIISISRSKEDSFDEAKANRREALKKFENEATKLANDKKNKKAIKKSNIKDKKDLQEKNEVNKHEQLDDQKEASTDVKHSIVRTSNKQVKAAIKSKEKHKINKHQESLLADNQKQQSTNSDTPEDSKNSAKLSADKVEKESKHKKGKDVDKVLQTNTETNQQQSSTTKVDNETITEATSSAQRRVATANQTSTTTSAALTQQFYQPQQVTQVKTSKKKRTETTLNQIKNDKEAISINLLMSAIQKAEISRSEIQMLIDALLNKQQDDVSEWLKGRQDPIVKLKKQLNDGELALKNEKELNIGLQAKLKELRNELNNERIAARNIDDQNLKLQNDLRANVLKFQAINDEKITISNNLQQLQHKLNEEQLMMKLKDDQIAKYKLNEENHHETVVSLQSQISQLSAKLQENVKIVEDYHKLQKEIIAYEGSQFTIKELQNQLNIQEKSLNEINIEMDKLVGNNKSLYEQNEALSNQLKNQCQEINILREKNESLAKLNAENWENGYAYKNNEQNLAEIEARLEDKTKQIEQLNVELEFNRNNIQELNLNLSRSLNDNGKIQLLLDKANNEIKLLKEKLNTRNIDEEVIEQLKNNIKERNKDIALLSSEIETCKQRNNALQSKNWKIAEALANAEQALKNKLKNEQNSNITNETNIEMEKIHGTIIRIMKHLFPEISLKDKDNIEDWLSYLEDAIIAKSINGSDKMKTPQELQMQNSHLQALVVRYKGIIVDTERILNQLQQNVEVEETKWKAKIQDLEQEIIRLKTEHHNNSDVLRF